MRVKDNRDGSYLTMLSIPGLKFGVINVVGNFGTVFVDQSYWQSAIAASPASAHKGYLLGGLVWFTIPFALATSLGLAGNALNVALTPDDANAGLVPPASATVLMGNGGGVMTIIMLFMAITSTGSAECIAVASLWAYDGYRKYINPNASGKQILMQSRIMVIGWAVVMMRKPPAPPMRAMAEAGGTRPWPASSEVSATLSALPARPREVAREKGMVNHTMPPRMKPL
jgi:Na+/proline symporter